MLQFDLNAKVRTKFGKGAAKSMRKEGVTPAVLYGPKKDSVALELDTKELTRILMLIRRGNAVFNLEVDDNGSSTKLFVMTKEIQTNPVDDTLMHTDFCEVQIDQPIDLGIPMKYIGNAKGVEMGGVLNASMRTVLVRGIVLEMPEFFEVDVTELEMGQSFKCDKIDLPEGLELLSSLDSVCVSIVAPREEEEVEVDDELDGEIDGEDDGTETDGEAASEPESDGAE